MHQNGEQKPKKETSQEKGLEGIKKI